MDTWESKEFREYIVNELINKDTEEKPAAKGILAYSGSVIRRENGQIVLTPDVNKEDKAGITSSVHVYRDGVRDILSEPPPPGTPGSHESPPTFSSELIDTDPLYYNEQENTIVSTPQEGYLPLYMTEKGVLTWEDTGVPATVLELAKQYTEPREELFKEYGVGEDYQPPVEFDQELNWKGKSYEEPMYFDANTRKFTTFETDTPVYLDADGAMTLEDTGELATFQKLESMAVTELDNQRLLNLLSASEEVFPKDTAVRNLLRNDDTEYAYDAYGTIMPVSTQKPSNFWILPQLGEFFAGSKISAIRQTSPSVDFLFDVLDLGWVTAKEIVNVPEPNLPDYKDVLDQRPKVSYGDNYLDAEDWKKSFEVPQPPSLKKSLVPQWDTKIQQIKRANARVKFSFNAMRAYENPEKYDQKALEDADMTPRDELLAEYILIDGRDELTGVFGLGATEEEKQAVQDALDGKIAEFENNKQLAVARTQRALDSGEMQLALDTMRYAVEQDRNAQVLNLTDDYYAWTWQQEPEKEEAFMDAVALVNVQRMYKGQPLMERWEIQELKYYYADAATEFAGGMVFDLLNVPVVSDVIGGIFKLAGTGVSDLAQKGFQAAIRNGVELDKWWLFKKAAKSTAHKLRYTASNTFSKVGFESARMGTDFVEDIGKVGDLISQARKTDITDVEALVKFVSESDSVARRFTPTEIDKLVELSKVIEPDQWSKLAAQAQQARIDKIVDEKLPYYMGKFADEGLEGQALASKARASAEKYALNVTSNPRTFIPDIAEEFSSIYVAKHRAWGSSGKDVAKNTEQLIDEYIPKVRREGILTDEKSIYKEAKKRAKAEAIKIADATPGTSRIMDDTLMGIIGKKYPSTRGYFESWQKFVDTASTVWVREVLSGRPGWAVINRIDSAARAVIGGLSAWDGVTAFLRSDLKDLVDDLGGDVPQELGQVLLEVGKDVSHYTDSVPYKLIYSDWKPLPGMMGFFSFFQDSFKAKWQAGFREGMTLKDKAWLATKSLYSARYNSVTKMSDMIEFNLRLRLYHKTFTNNLAKLEGDFLVDSLSELSPTARSIAKRWWKQSSNRPGRMFDFSKGSGHVAFLIPDEVYKELDRLSPADRQGFSNLVADALDARVQDIVAGGRDVNNKDINLFFSDLIHQMQKAQAEKIDSLKMLTGAADTMPDPSKVGKDVSKQAAEMSDALINKNSKDYIPSNEDWLDKLISWKSNMLPDDEIPTEFTPEFVDELKRAGIDTDVYKRPQPFIEKELSIYDIPDRKVSLEREKEILAGSILRQDEIDESVLESIKSRNARISILDYREASQLPEEYDFQYWVADRVTNSYQQKVVDYEVVEAYLLRKQDDAVRKYLDHMSSLVDADDPFVKAGRNFLEEYEESPAKWLKVHTPERKYAGFITSEQDAAREAFASLARKIEMEVPDPENVRRIYKDAPRKNEVVQNFQSVSLEKAAKAQEQIHISFRNEVRKLDVKLESLSTSIAADDAWNEQLSKLNKFYSHVFPGPIDAEKAQRSSLWELFDGYSARARTTYKDYLLGLKDNISEGGLNSIVKNTSTVDFLTSNGIEPVFYEGRYMGFVWTDLDSNQSLYLKTSAGLSDSAAVIDNFEGLPVHYNTEIANALEINFNLTSQRNALEPYDILESRKAIKDGLYKSIPLDVYYDDDVNRAMLAAQKNLKEGSPAKAETVLRTSARTFDVSTAYINKSGQLVPSDHHLLNIVSGARGQKFETLADFIAANDGDVFKANEDLRQILEARSKAHAIENLSESAATWRKKVHLSLREFIPVPQTKEFIGKEEAFYTILEKTWDSQANYWARQTGRNPDFWYLEQLNRITGEADNVPKLYQDAAGNLVHYSRVSELAGSVKVEMSASGWKNYLIRHGVDRGSFDGIDDLFDFLDANPEQNLFGSAIQDFLGESQVFLSSVPYRTNVDLKGYTFPTNLYRPLYELDISTAAGDAKQFIRVGEERIDGYDDTIMAFDFFDSPEKRAKKLVDNVNTGVHYPQEIKDLINKSGGYRTQDVQNEIMQLKLKAKRPPISDTITVDQFKNVKLLFDTDDTIPQMVKAIDKIKSNINYTTPDAVTMNDVVQWLYENTGWSGDYKAIGITKLQVNSILDRAIEFGSSEKNRLLATATWLEKATVDIPQSEFFYKSVVDRTLRFALDEGYSTIAFMKTDDIYDDVFQALVTKYGGTIKESKNIVGMPTYVYELPPAQPKNWHDPAFKRWVGSQPHVFDHTKGKPLSIFHGTNKEYEAFRIFNPSNGEIGAHFGGNVAQAEARSGGIVLEMYTNIQKPLVYDGDFTRWNIDAFIKMFKESGYEDISIDLQKRWNDLQSYKIDHKFDERGEILTSWIKQALNDAGGFDSVKYRNQYEAFSDPRNIAAGKWSYIVFDPTNVKSIDNVGSWGRGTANFHYQTTTKGTKKAATIFAKEGGNILEFYKAADVSSFFHESGHVVLRMLDGDDLVTAAKFLEIDPGELTTLTNKWIDGTLLQGTAEYDTYVKAHETWARTTEKYFLEELEPAHELEGIFKKIKRWLRDMYTRIRYNLSDIEISDPVKALLDDIYRDLREPGINSPVYKRHGWWSDVMTNPKATSAAKYEAALEQLARTPISEYPEDIQTEVLDWFRARKRDIDEARNGYRAVNVQYNPEGKDIVTYVGEESTIPDWAYPLGWRGGNVRKGNSTIYSPTYSARYYHGETGGEGLRKLWEEILGLNESATAMVAVDAKREALNLSVSGRKYAAELAGVSWEDMSLAGITDEITKTKKLLSDSAEIMSKGAGSVKELMSYNNMDIVMNDVYLNLPRRLEAIAENINKFYVDTDQYGALMEDYVGLTEVLDKLTKSIEADEYKTWGVNLPDYLDVGLNVEKMDVPNVYAGSDIVAARERMPIVNEFQALFEGDVLRYDNQEWVLAGRDGNNLTLINRDKPWLQKIVNSKTDIVSITNQRVGETGKRLFQTGFADAFDYEATRNWGSIVDSIPEEYRDDVDELWSGYIQAPRYADGRSLKDLWGDTTSSYSSLVTYLSKRRDEMSSLLPGQGSQSLSNGYQRLIDQIEAEYTYIASAAFDPTKVMAPMSMTKYPDGLQSWIDAVETGLGELEQYTSLLDTWNKSLVDQLEKTGYKMTIDPEVLKELQGWVERGVGDKENMINLIKYGGKDINGKNVTGAINHTNKTMLDYTDFGTVDQFMKSIFPFWMFPSRSIPWWIGTAATKPRILAFYNKYMRASKIAAYNQKMITSTGKQLPSTTGYFRIPGTDLWINPLAPISAKVAFKVMETASDAIESRINGTKASYSSTAEDNPNDLTPMQEVTEILYQQGNSYGFSLPPWLLIPAMMGGLVDKNRNPRYSLIPAMDFIPPWTQDAVNGFLANKAVGADKKTQSSFLFSYTPWEDYMVERELLADLAEYINNPELTQADKYKRANQIRQVIKNVDRENDPIWTEKKRSMDVKEYKTKLFGFFTGIYVKPFSDGMVQLNKIRDDINLLYATINNDLNAEIFGYYGDPQERWERMASYAYNSPAGLVNQMYNDVRFVVYPETGQQAVGMDRRVLLADRINVEEQTDAYYEKLNLLSQELNERQQAMVIGATGAEISAMWEWYFGERDALEKTEMYKYAQRSWSERNKPISMVKDHYEKMWWQYIKETRPLWDQESETYGEYMQKVSLWEAALPQAGKSLYEIFTKNHVSDRLFVEGALSGEKYFETLYAQTNKEGLDAYNKKTDSAYEALDAAWKDLYFDPYWNVIDGLKGTERRLAEERFLRDHPNPPSLEELTDWVETNYPGQFQRSEIMRSARGRSAYTIEERIEAGNSPVQNTSNEMFDMFGWAGPYGSPRWYTIKDKFVELGGDDASYDALFYSGGKMEGVANARKLEEDKEILRKAMEELGIEEPTIAELQEWKAAEALNNLYKETAGKIFGSDIFDLRSEYYSLFYSEQKEFRTERKGDYQRIKDFNKWRNEWTENNSLWRKYYRPDYVIEGEETPSTSGTSASSYYAGKKGAYTTYYRRSGGGGSGFSKTKNYFTTLGYRTTMDARQLLMPGVLGKAGNGGTLNWSTETRTSVSPSIIASLEAGNVITQPQVSALKNIKS